MCLTFFFQLIAQLSCAVFYLFFQLKYSVRCMGHLLYKPCNSFAYQHIIILFTKYWRKQDQQINQISILRFMATKNLEVIKRISNHRGVVSQSVENGVVRMKILVKREDLEQVLEKVRSKQNHVNLRPMGSRSLEQRLKDMKRMRIRQRKGDCRKYWRPALESIPEAGVLTIWGVRVSLFLGAYMCQLKIVLRFVCHYNIYYMILLLRINFLPSD